jgi:radical SAM superfamily enzyme YgiQ (UPF0313 family)
MMTAYAREWRDGHLAARYDISRIMSPDHLLAALHERRGPAVLLLSNYMWSLPQNIELAQRAKAANPDLFIVHGGPSTPKYEGDAAAFFAEHDGLADVLVRGEGEGVLVALLDALPPDLSAAGLEAVAGITYRDPTTGSLVRTPDQDRLADLDELPSPYLSGEFRDVNPSAITVIETNRGCPYGCTFCDWGSATLSRIRKFDLDRVEAEMRWCAEQELPIWMVADANFGIFARDVEVAERMAAVRRETGMPRTVAIHVAKNTTRHLVQIVDILVASGIRCHPALSLQSSDEETLAAIERKNISAEHYAKLAAELRGRHLPVVGDLMVCLPGQTTDSYRRDLQFLIDHDIAARTWITQLLPNSPMNDPEYRERFQLKADSRGLIVSSSTFDRHERAAMLRLRHSYTALEHFGVARHLLRFLQWDHGIEASEVLRVAAEVTHRDPTAYPLLSFVQRSFDVVTTTPFGWTSFLDELRRFVIDELGVADSSALTAVLAVQRSLMPDWGRALPETISIPHDYEAYYRDATASLRRSGIPDGPPAALETYAPGEFTVRDDPDGLCQRPSPPHEWARSEAHVSTFWTSEHWELDSSLLRSGIPEVAGMPGFVGDVEFDPGVDPAQDEPVALSESDGAIRVAIGPTRRRWRQLTARR